MQVSICPTLAKIATIRRKTIEQQRHTAVSRYSSSRDGSVQTAGEHRLNFISVKIRLKSIKIGKGLDVFAADTETETMQICIPEPPTPERPVSIIEAKNKIRLGHDECCDCYCCCMPQPTCLKYVQPEVPKSFAPIQRYWKSNTPMDDNTTYKLSYWENSPAVVDPLRPEDNLIVGEGPISNETTHKMSYLGNWCVKPDSPIVPCAKQWLGRGPMQGVTTQKHDYTWKLVDRPESCKMQNNLYAPCAALSDDTTYRLSYLQSGCNLPSPSYACRREYVKPEVPMEGCTTYKLSYWPNEAPVQEEHPWAKKREYQPPINRVDNCTTYRLSYWPQCEKLRSPFTLKDTENLLNAGCCLDDNTTYRLSYFNCGGDRRDPIIPIGNVALSTCPLSHDTINRLSFLGNWCFKPDSPKTPCDRQMLGRGPMQDVTTQKHDYTWRLSAPPSKIRPENNLVFSPLPLECCTTNRLSYMPNNLDSVLQMKSFAPKSCYKESDIPMEKETTMRLSYQPVQPVHQTQKPWLAKEPYHLPTTCMEDYTTYNLSYIPPGTLHPLPQCSEVCSSLNNRRVPPCQPCPAS